MIKINKYEAYKPSGVKWLGEIPEHWEMKRIKFLFNIGRGRVISQKELIEDGLFPVYSSQTQDNGVLGFINTYDFDCNQLTWTTDGANAGTIFLREGKHNCTNVCGTLQSKNNDLTIEFIKFSLQVAAQFYKRPDTNGAKIMNGEMAEIFVTFPPREEQTAIASFLDRKTAQIEQAIAQKMRMIELLKERRQIIIHNAVTRGLNPNVKMKDSGVEWIGEIPEHWAITKAKFYSKVFVPERAKPELNDEKNGLPWVTTEHLRNTELFAKDVTYYVSELAIRKTGSRVIKSNSVIATCVGNFGIASKLNFDCIINQQIQGYTDLQINADYLTHLISISEDYFKNNSTLTTIMYVSKDTFGCLPILIPSDQEQNTIVTYIERTSNKITTAITLKKKEIEKFKEYKSTLINSAVTGKIKVCKISEP